MALLESLPVVAAKWDNWAISLPVEGDPRRRAASTIKTVNDLNCDGESRIIISNQ